MMDLGGGGMEQIIELPFTYHFEHALIRLSGDPVNRVDLQERKVWIPMQEGNAVVLQAIGTTEKPEFKLLNCRNAAQIERVKTIFHFHRSLDDVHNHFSSTDLAPIFDRFKGMPLVRSYSLYGRLMKGIIHQQLNKTFANTLTLRFVEAYGHQVDGVWFYPTPERIAELPIEVLRVMQFSERKASYIIGLSKAITEGKLDLEELANLPNEEVVERLTAFKGIGPWTAQNFLLFGLGRENLFPLADVGLQNALKKLWTMERKPNADEITVHFEEWSPYLSYAALYLWKSIEVEQ